MITVTSPNVFGVKKDEKTSWDACKAPETASNSENIIVLERMMRWNQVLIMFMVTPMGKKYDDRC